MKNFLPILFTFLFVNALHSQCKVETDPFTKDLLAKFNYTGVNAIQVGKDLTYPPCEFFIDLKNGEGNMGFTYNYPTRLDNTIPKDGEVLMKLENDEILKFKLADDAKATLFTFGKNKDTWSKYSYTFKVTKGDIEKLSQLSVVLMRFPDASKSGNVDCNDYSKAIRKGAECVTK